MTSGLWDIEECAWPWFNKCERQPSSELPRQQSDQWRSHRVHNLTTATAKTREIDTAADGRRICFCRQRTRLQRWKRLVVVQKASRRCYLIFKSFQSRNTELLVRAFKTYVRPLLEINSQVWSPHLLKDIRRLDTVLRRFTKNLDGLHTFPYTERLTLFNLERLEVRRIRADLLFVYKLLFGFTALRAEDYFNLSVCTATSYKLFLTRCFTDVRNFFSLIVWLKYGMSFLVTLILHVLILLSADLLVLIKYLLWSWLVFWSAFYTVFCLRSIVTFTALRQCLVPAVADEPTTYVVPFCARRL